MDTLPTTTKAVVRNPDNTSEYKEMPLKTLEADEVLVRVCYAPINPSDVYYVRGDYPTSPELENKAVICGFEGSGEIVAAGGEDKSRVGQKVCFITQEGTWTEYVILKAQMAIQVPPSMTLTEAANCFVNPCTVEGFIDTCKEKGHTTIVHSAAVSNLGRMLVKACQDAGIKLIGVVRRQEQVDILKSLGAELYVNTGEENWEEKASELFKKEGAQAFFDAVGGEAGSKVFKAMPNGTVTYCYGLLSEKDYNVGAMDLVFRQKVLKGWWLQDCMVDPAKFGELIQRAMKNLATKAFKTEICDTYPQEKFKEAIDFYMKNATKGKIFLKNSNCSDC